jgi:hypothetical protein
MGVVFSAGIIADFWLKSNHSAHFISVIYTMRRIHLINSYGVFTQAFFAVYSGLNY